MSSSPAHSQNIYLSPSPSKFNINEKRKESSRSVSDSMRKFKTKIKSKLPLNELKKYYPGIQSSFVNMEKTMVSLGTRRDTNGTEINKKNKKLVKVTFIDDLTNNTPLAEIINVESFKEYNIDLLLQPFRKAFPLEKNQNCCSCLII